MGGASSETRKKGESKTEMFERFGQSDKVPDEPEIPQCVEHVVRWFFELSNRRGSGMSGGLPITFEAISAWSALLQTMPTEDEVRMIMAMDSAYLSAAHKDDEDEAQEPPTSAPLRK